MWASFFKLDVIYVVQNIWISLKVVTFSNKNFTNSIPSSFPEKSEIQTNFREDLKQQGTEFNVQISPSNP